jgi:hypothetical protein
MRPGTIVRQALAWVVLASSWCGSARGDLAQPYTVDWPEHRFTPQGSCQVVCMNVFSPSQDALSKNPVYYCFHAEVRSEGPLDRLRIVDEEGRPWTGRRGRATKHHEPGLVRIDVEVPGTYLDELRRAGDGPEIDFSLHVVVLNEEGARPVRVLPGLRVVATPWGEEEGAYVCRIVDRAAAPPNGALDRWTYKKRASRALPPGLTPPPEPPEAWNHE